MAWLRSGDNAATYPPLLKTMSVVGADSRSLNEVAGWVWRCAMQSAGHYTDGLIDLGTAVLMGNGHHEELLRIAAAAGLIAERQGPGGEQVWQVIDDPEFLHIRSKASVEWDRQRDRDRKNPGLTAPVRARDGDACRYCGLVVNYRARTGGRAGTYADTRLEQTLDHTEPGGAATSETMVVCCKSCNSSMQDGQRLELLPPPVKPFFHPATVEWLHQHGLTPAGYRREPARPDEDLTPGGHRRNTRPAPTEDTAPEYDPDPAAEGATRIPHQSATLNEDTAPECDPDTTAEGATRIPHQSATLGQPGRHRSDHARPAMGGHRSEPARPAQWVIDEGHVPDPGQGSSPARNSQEPLAASTGIPVGTGRGGTGRAGSGRDGPGRAGAGAQGGNRRRRGRRSRGGKGGGLRG